MGEDEEATLRTLTAHREEMTTIIRQHRGRLVGTAGDSVLAEFVSAVDAVQCAVVIQATLKAEKASPYAHPRASGRHRVSSRSSSELFFRQLPALET